MILRGDRLCLCVYVKERERKEKGERRREKENVSSNFSSHDSPDTGQRARVSHGRRIVQHALWQLHEGVSEGHADQSGSVGFSGTGENPVGRKLTNHIVTRVTPDQQGGVAVRLIRTIPLALSQSVLIQMWRNNPGDLLRDSQNKYFDTVGDSSFAPWQMLTIL